MTYTHMITAQKKATTLVAQKANYSYGTKGNCICSTKANYMSCTKGHQHSP